MSNSYFRFKQFTIDQSRCAMKVTTDACIQGAWTPIGADVNRILDIGTGTGLLALMLAQRSNARVAAIELDAEAAQQAVMNIAASPWAERLQVWQGDVNTYPAEEKYDLVISNPPFFKNSLLGREALRNQARHAMTLSQEQLFSTIDRNLSENGTASVLLPVPEYTQWAQLIKRQGWSEQIALHIRHTEGAAVKRVVSTCSRKKNSGSVVEELVIKNGDSYTASFSHLLSPFYLFL